MITAILFDNNAFNGKLLVGSIINYRSSLLKNLNSDYPEVTTEVKYNFQTEATIDKYGKTQSWLDYNFKDFPSVAVPTKWTQLQVNIRTVESEICTDYLRTLALPTADRKL